LLINPAILILDEATSSVDTETERDIQAALDHLIQGRTTIAIAHRLSTLRKADRLVVMERGRIVEMGAHQELLDAGGAYARLHDAHLGNGFGFELNFIPHGERIKKNVERVSGRAGQSRSA
jgi:ATP-binding cassette subfamily B protein